MGSKAVTKKPSGSVAGQVAAVTQEEPKPNEEQNNLPQQQKAHILTVRQGQMEEKSDMTIILEKDEFLGKKGILSAPNGSVNDDTSPSESVYGSESNRVQVHNQ